MILDLNQLAQLRCNTRGLYASNIDDDTTDVVHYDQGTPEQGSLHLRMADTPEGVVVWGWLAAQEGDGEIDLDDDELMQAIELHKPYLPVGWFPREGEPSVWYETRRDGREALRAFVVFHHVCYSGIGHPEAWCQQTPEVEMSNGKPSLAMIGAQYTRSGRPEVLRMTPDQFDGFFEKVEL